MINYQLGPNIDLLLFSNTSRVSSHLVATNSLIARAVVAHRGLVIIITGVIRVI